MAPGVFRDGVLKTHLAFNARVLMYLMDGEGESFSQVYFSSRTNAATFTTVQHSMSRFLASCSGLTISEVSWPASSLVWAGEAGANMRRPG
jgi:hypothetical protein